MLSNAGSVEKKSLSNDVASPKEWNLRPPYPATDHDFGGLDKESKKLNVYYGVKAMGAKRKKILIIAGAATLIVVAAIVVGVLSFNINSYKHRVENAASAATGLDFRINGKMGLSLAPFGVSAKDIHVANKEGEILSLENLKIGVELLPLLKEQLKVTSCELVKPAVTIVKNADGKYNFENSEKKSTEGEGGQGASYSIKKLGLSQGSLVYLDKKTGEKTELKEINLAIRDLSIGDTAKDIMKNISFTGTLDCKEVVQNDFRIENLKTSVTAAKGIYNLQHLAIGTLVYFDKKTGEKSELKETNLAIKDLSMGDTPKDIMKNISFTGTLDCKEVVQNDFKIENFKTSVKTVKGIYSFEPLAIGTLVYFDRKTGEKTELKEINLAIKDLSMGDTAKDIMKNISFTGTIGCKTFQKKDLKIDDFKSSMDAQKGVIHLIPLTMDIFDGKGAGDVTADMSAVDVVYKINLKLSKLDFAKLEESFGAKKVIGGKGDLSASLTMIQKGSRNPLSSLDGTFSVRGDNLVMYTMDLDKVLTSFETTQRFNLVDLGAFFIAGPLGTTALKGYHYGEVYNESRGGQGVITRLVSDWNIKDGVANATDCALATHHNRVALKGKLNLVSERYDNVTVALLDGKGCAKFKQNISGPFGSPKIGAVSAVESLGAPIFKLYDRARGIVQGGKCEVFYNGSVRQP